MLCALIVRTRQCLLLFLVSIAFAGVAGAQTVWSGFDISFTKGDFFNPNLPESQDRITDNVWLTRDVQQGIFNIRLEPDFADDLTSPADTEWATDLNNPGGSLSAMNWGNLNFSTWVEAYGGQLNVGHNIVGRNAVVHLISDDVYLDIVFTQWTTNQSGGGFSNMRADGELVPPPGPTGDYNDNGVVDAADYTVWRDTFGASVTPGDGADGDESGTIDTGDYTFWKSHFGETVPGAGAGLAAAAVPEPTSTVLLLAGILLSGPLLLRARSATAIARQIGLRGAVQ